MEKSTEKNGKVSGARSNGNDAAGELKERGTEMLHQAQTAVTDFTNKIDLKGKVNANPIGMVAAAFGIGYILGGGLFTRFTGRLFSIGVRVAVLPALKYALADGANQLLKSGA